MKSAVAGTMNFNMFGIPLVGPDIPAAADTFPSKECDIISTRRVMLSTFFPFARQVSDKGD